MLKLRHEWLAASAAIFLAACSGGQRADAPVDSHDTIGSGGYRGTNDSRLGDFIDFGGGGGAGGESLTPVNRYLWRASLDTLSYLPLASTDPFTGVVATDWATSPEAPGERFKVTAYVKSVELAPSSLQVAVFREVRDDNGAWVTAPVAGETARRLEDAILLRARQIKIERREAEG
ncbi:MAG: DUF3576 domain-containing protein [Pikeienuella sp.]